MEIVPSPFHAARETTRPIRSSCALDTRCDVVQLARGQQTPQHARRVGKANDGGVARVWNAVAEWYRYRDDPPLHVPVIGYSTSRHVCRCA